MPKRKLSLFILFFLVASSYAFAQGRKISGIVTDKSRNPLSGASIGVKNSLSAGAITDDNGFFIINVPDDAAILTFSYVGMQTQEIPINNRTKIDVTMENDGIRQQEVIVVGYGTQKRSDVTGSVASVKIKELEKTPIGRVDQALQGRVSGVVVQNTDAAPGSSNIAIRIRGSNSINGGNNPLVVIDGMQGGSLTTLNQNDVESIEILKDASATAIYGSRGANGVIIVTTKKGKTGKAAISYNGFVTSSRIREKLDLLNAGQYAETVNARRVDNNLATVFTPADIAAFKANGGTDWQDVIFRNAITQNHQLSIGGATDNLSYYVSGNAFDQKGIIERSSYQRYSLRSNLRVKANEKLSVGVNMFLSREADHPVALNTFAGQNAGSPVFSALVWAPVKPIYDAHGNYTQPGDGYGPVTNYNPLALAIEPVRDYYSNKMNVIGNVDYQIIQGLTLTLLGAYQNSNSENNDYFNSKPTNAPGTELATINNNKYVAIQNTNMLSYEKDMQQHHLKLTAVVEQQYEESSGSFAGARGFPANTTTYNNLGLGSFPQTPFSFRNKRSLLSYMGRINYGYDNRYLLTVTGRADGSSVFGKNNKWGTFPSVAISWNVSNEEFMQSISNTISALKIRASYGLVGNQAISPYQSLATLNTGAAYPVNGTSVSTGVALGNIESADLKWEKTEQTNIGADLQLLDGRIDVTADYYYKKTSDLLLLVPLPMTAGGNGAVYRNIGSVENKGVELYIGGRPVVKNIMWETGFTIAFNRNRVTALNSGQTDQLLVNDILPGFTNSFWLQVGEPLGLFRGYEYDGVWKSGEASKAATFGAVPGDSKYVDQNGDGAIDDLDIVNIGHAQPKFTYGWNNSFSWRNLDLNVFIQGVEGNKIYNLSRVRLETDDATSTKILERWTPQNDNTDVPSFKGSNDGKIASSRWLEDGSYLRFKNIALGYKLPQTFLNRLKISSARLYVSALNLITFTDYTGFEPEASTGIDSRAGVDLATYPSQKSFTIGLDIKF